MDLNERIQEAKLWAICKKLQSAYVGLNDWEIDALARGILKAIDNAEQAEFMKDQERSVS